MKLQTQFTFPKKDLCDLDYVNKVEVLEKLLKERIKMNQLKKVV